MTANELRFALTASMAAEFEQRAAIGLALPAGRHRSLWFDTPAGDLLNAGTSLAVSQGAGGWSLTIEVTGDGPGEHRRSEHPVAGPRPEREALPPVDEPLGRLAHAYFPLLVPVFEAELERQVRLVGPQPGLRIEMACERGELRAGQRGERIAEVVLRRLEGPAAAFYHYAAQWAAMHGAQLLLASMHLRGLELAGWRPPAPRPVRMTPVSPPAGATIAQAARDVIGGHLDHAVANFLPVLGGTHRGGPRQLRVALRRLCAAIRFFDLVEPEATEPEATEPEVTGPEAAGPGSTGPAPEGGGATRPRWRGLVADARALRAAAAPLREADVLAQGVLADLNRALGDDAALQVLAQALARAREHERARLRATLASPEATAFILRARAALGTLSSGRPDARDFGSFAAGRLARLVARARRRTRRARTEDDWHRARLALKELRDGLQSCRSLPATRGSAADAIAMLSRWQRSLGKVQDLVRAKETVARALAHGDAPVETAVRAAALVDGYRAAAFATHRPARLRKPILGGLARLLAPAPPAPESAGYHRSDRPREEEAE